jgi:hypothetical protein
LSSEVLLWPAADLSKMDLYDRNRITEDGAEAIALALAHQHRDLRVVRRVQQHADWLLEDHKGDKHERVALEVSGVDRSIFSLKDEPERAGEESRESDLLS